MPCGNRANIAYKAVYALWSMWLTLLASQTKRIIIFSMRQGSGALPPSCYKHKSER